MDDDASGLTFEEWDPTADVDDTQPPAAMIINSSELRGAGFNLKEVLPPEFEAAARGGKRTRGPEALGWCVLRAWAVSGTSFHQMLIQI